MEPCIRDEDKERFFDISRSMAAALRKDIIKDTGNSGLKKKSLDLITILRLEKSVQVDSFKRSKTLKYGN